MTKNTSTLIEMFLAACLGMAVVVLPSALDPNTRKYDAAFLPVVRNAVEGVKPISFLLLFVVGLVFGCLGKGHFGIVGMSSMAFFPAWSVLDMMMGHDHNLFPIEWAMYGIYSLLAVIGAGLGRFVTRRFVTKSGGPQPWYR